MYSKIISINQKVKTFSFWIKFDFIFKDGKNFLISGDNFFILIEKNLLKIYIKDILVKIFELKQKKIYFIGFNFHKNYLIIQINDQIDEILFKNPIDLDVKLIYPSDFFSTMFYTSDKLKNLDEMFISQKDKAFKVLSFSNYFIDVFPKLTITPENYKKIPIFNIPFFSQTISLWFFDYDINFPKDQILFGNYRREDISTPFLLDIETTNANTLILKLHVKNQSYNHISAQSRTLYKKNFFVFRFVDNFIYINSLADDGIKVPRLKINMKNDDFSKNLPYMNNIFFGSFSPALYWINGKIKNLTYYDTFLSDEQIDEIYNNQKF